MPGAAAEHEAEAVAAPAAVDPNPVVAHAAPPRAAAALAMQRAAGNAAVSAMVAGGAGGAGGAGARIPAGSAAAALLGPAAGAVQIHRGAVSDARLASRPGALAVTEGADIHLGSSAPAIGTPGGDLLLAHEAAHVVQQSQPGPASSAELAEAEADDAAVAASLGRPVRIGAAARGPQFFEAHKHQATLSAAMKANAFTDAEGQAAYFGNWCRDLSQALVPSLSGMIGANATFTLVNLMAIRHFGHGVTPAQLGSYDPVEHIDNPAGTTDKDILDQGKQTIAGVPGTDDPINTGHAQNVAGSAADTQDLLSPGRIAESFVVNEAGVPAYITRSKEYIFKEFGLAVGAGRTETGLYHLGNFSHTCEDLFAHSNWVEMAVGLLIKDNKLPGVLDQDVEQETHARVLSGRPPVEDYAAQVADRAGNVRPVLLTGTFTGTSSIGDDKHPEANDTFISLSEEAKNLLPELDPFKEGADKASEWAFVSEVLAHADAAGDDGTLGPILIGVFEPVFKKIKDSAAKATGPVDGLEGKAHEALGNGALGNVAAGAAHLLGQGVHAVADPMSKDAAAVFRASVEAVANSIGSGGVSLLQLAVWYQRGEGAVQEAWDDLKSDVKQLPEELVALILPEMVKAERDFKQAVQKIGSAAYDKATRKLFATAAAGGPQSKTLHTEATNVDQKYLEQANELADFMAKAYETIDTEHAAAHAAELEAFRAPRFTDSEADKGRLGALIAYASGTFMPIIRRLVTDAEAQGEMADKIEGQTNHLSQLSKVPGWARAGASHSQIAKDHATSPFFGVAFKLANLADTTLVGLVKEAWAGQPAAPGLEQNFGETDAQGNQKMEQPKPGEEARPALADGGGHATEWQQESRKSYLELRKEGEDIAKEGVANEHRTGAALTAAADRLAALIRATPGLAPALGQLVTTLRSNPNDAAVVAAVEAAKGRFDAYVADGQLDEAVLEEIDEILGHVKGLYLGKDEDAAYDIHSPKQIALLDQHRGPGGTPIERRDKDGNLLADAHVNATLVPGHDTALDRAAKAATTPQGKFHAEIERIFGHPYDSDWWVAPVTAWANQNKRTLSEYIRDRNSGKGEVH